MKYISLTVVSTVIALMTTFCSSGENQRSPFKIDENDQGVGLTEDGKPVFFYQKKPKSLNGQYICCNYIHPLYDTSGDTLTEEFPADHPYHRGVFWAWHQLYVNNKSLGDGWINDSISQEVVNVIVHKNRDSAQFSLHVLWRSSALPDGKPFIEENSIVTVHKLENMIRKIDFKIMLTPQVDGFQIGGSADEKGYGGFCLRMKLPDGLIFTSDNGQVTPQELQIKAGPWMDFSGPFGRENKISGLTLLCSPAMPDYPEPWILRQHGSMQNIVFPGRSRIDAPRGVPIVLQYRLIVHNGNSESINIRNLMKEYADLPVSR